MVAFMGAPGLMELLVIVLTAAILIVPFWKIFAKAGFPGALALLMLVPLVNLIMIYVLAFAQWPSLKTEGMKQKKPIFESGPRH